MKNRIKPILVVAALIICTILTCTGVVVAPSVYNNGKINLEFFCYPKKANNINEYYMFDNMTSDSKVKSIKSSDSKIATAKWSPDNPYAIKITVKKKGKTDQPYH